MKCLQNVQDLTRVAPACNVMKIRGADPALTYSSARSDGLIWGGDGVIEDLIMRYGMDTVLCYTVLPFSRSPRIAMHFHSSVHKSNTWR